jgi:hypothetical protein
MDATRVVVIGFSFRPTDAHFKYLLAAGLMENSSLRRIIVVNPHASTLAPRIRSVLRGDQFEYGVIVLRDRPVREFFHDVEVCGSLGVRCGMRGWSWWTTDRGS